MLLRAAPRIPSTFLAAMHLAEQMNQPTYIIHIFQFEESLAHCLLRLLPILCSALLHLLFGMLSMLSPLPLVARLPTFERCSVPLSGSAVSRPIAPFQTVHCLLLVIYIHSRIYYMYKLYLYICAHYTHIHAN